MPGGSLQSKPTWSNAFGCFTMPAFFVLAMCSGRNCLLELSFLGRWLWDSPYGSCLELLRESSSLV